jgi:hypothetical protein
MNIMKTIFLKHLSDDCTIVEWELSWHAGRLMCYRKNRWHGARDAIKLTARMSLAEARQITEQYINDIFESQAWTSTHSWKRGEVLLEDPRFVVTSTGNKVF